jgi:hypothetical protein
MHCCLIKTLNKWLNCQIFIVFDSGYHGNTILHGFFGRMTLSLKFYEKIPTSLRVMVYPE